MGSQQRNELQNISNLLSLTQFNTEKSLDEYKQCSCIKCVWFGICNRKVICWFYYNFSN